MRFRVFDGWRFAASLLVMLYHFLFQGPQGLEAPVIAFAERLTPLLDMFFMLSGFLVAARYGESAWSGASYRRFLRRRAARIVPLHLLTLGFFVALVPVFALGFAVPAEPERWSLAALPANLLMLHALGFTEGLAFNYPSWSVSAELFCYALFPLVLLVGRRARLAGLVLLLALWVAGLEAASRAGVFPGGDWLKADTLGAYRAFADFVFGAVLHRLALRLVVRAEGRAVAHGPGCAALGLALGAMLLDVDGRLAVLLMGLALLLSAAAEMSAPDSTRRLGPLEPFGQASFGIYLWHPVMETLFLSLLWKRVLAPAEPSQNLFLSYLLLPVAATVAVALVSSRLVEPRLARLLSGRPAPRPDPLLAPA